MEKSLRLPKVEFTFLGTGTSQGVPIIGCDCEVCSSADPKDKRLRTAGMITDGKTRIVIDTGPDFRQQMLREKIRSLDAIVFTHQHKDHVAGLDDVRAFNYLQKRDMPLYAHDETIERLKVEFGYAFGDNLYPGVPRLKIHEIGTEAFQINEINLQPVPVRHKDMKVLGFRVNDFAYITDANLIPESSFELIAGVKMLVLNALRRTPHYSHFTLEEAIKVAQRVGASQTWFTHISHLLGRHEEVESELPDGIHLAWDGLKLKI